MDKKECNSTYAIPPKVFLLWTVLLSLAFGWIFWDFLQRQFRFAIEQQADWGHTLVIPFIAGYFVYRSKHRLLSEPFRKAWFGLVLVLIGLVWYTFCALGPTAWHHHNFMGAGVACTMTGIILFLFGWRAMTILLFPLVYIFAFSQTISDRFMEIITFQLQDIAAVGSYYGLSFIGLDVTRAGNTIEIFYNNVSYPLNIAEACSGMRMLMAFLALGVAMAYTGLPYLWQRVVLIGLAVPTAVFVNILRVMTLGLLSIADSGFAAGDFHTFVGTLWLIPAFLVYLGIVWVLKHLVIEDEEEDEPEQESNGIRFAGSTTSGLIHQVCRFLPWLNAQSAERCDRWIACNCGFVITLSLLASTAIGLQVAVGALNVYLHKEPVFPRKDFSVLPSVLNGWEKVGEDTRFDAAGVEALGTDRYLSRMYMHQDLTIPAMQLHIAYYTGQVDAVPHVPDRCLVAGGFVQKGDPITLPLNLPQDEWEYDPQYTMNGIPYPYVYSVDAFTREKEVVRLPIGDFELRTTEFSHPRMGTDIVYAGYFFIANGKTTAYPGRIRLLAFDRSAQYAYYCKVQFMIQSDRFYSAEQFRDVVSGFVSDMLPEIMKCLPDWVEVSTPSEPNKPKEN